MIELLGVVWAVALLIGLLRQSLVGGWPWSGRWQVHARELWRRVARHL